MEMAHNNDIITVYGTRALDMPEGSRVKLTDLGYPIECVIEYDDNKDRCQDCVLRWEFCEMFVCSPRQRIDKQSAYFVKVDAVYEYQKLWKCPQRSRYRRMPISKG